MRRLPERRLKPVPALRRVGDLPAAILTWHTSLESPVHRKGARRVR